MGEGVKPGRRKKITHRVGKGEKTRGADHMGDLSKGNV